MKQNHWVLRRQSREEGFSLAEVVIATALLGVILLALFGLLTSGVQRAYSGKKTTQGAMIAQAVLEQANVYQPQSLLGAAGTASTASRTWTRDVDSTLPAAESGSTSAISQRNAWRNLLATADLPASDEFPAILRVSMTALPSGRTFANANIVRVQVDLTWNEWGKRPRQVRLQSLNLPVTP